MEQTPDTNSLTNLLNFLGINANFTPLGEETDNEDIDVVDGASEFTSFLALPDDEFQALSTIFFSELQLALSDSTTKYLLLTTLRSQGIDITQMRDEVGSALEIIDDLTDLSDMKKDFLRRLVMMIAGFIENGVANEEALINVFVEKMSTDVQLPQYANEGDSGMDIYALDDFTIDPGKSILIPTGLKVAIPNGYELQVRPKSGLSAKSSLRIANSPGTIDSLYRDEIKVIVENNASPIKAIDYHFNTLNKIVIDSIEHGSPIYITKGQKFAQLVLMKVPKAVFTEVASILDISGNRGGGFGSTGV